MRHLADSADWAVVKLCLFLASLTFPFCITFKILCVSF